MILLQAKQKKQVTEGISPVLFATDKTPLFRLSVCSFFISVLAYSFCHRQNKFVSLECLQLFHYCFSVLLLLLTEHVCFVGAFADFSLVF